ncbi:Uma2 family endonuclease [Argonema galeatum]|uniref:Uma2 family endonuclease n=1 Tax=Argonema galeatum TaxID=2942762 RepID=UPI00201180B5|nr:Uma2 family endonuclease [Argonema galeatum]MCL1464768.1 Uma2 family endonuclease [Argonema galeatum A003/A1]
MVVNKNQFYISPELYLKGEEVSPIKHEYRRGHVYAMTGAKNPHVIITGNLVTQLNNFLSDSPCIVLALDTKVRLEAANCFYYPDVVVTCDERDTTSTADFILYPSLIIEVLSKSTADFDRGDKFADYQTSSTLREYVLVSQSEILVECYRLNDEGIWVSQTYRESDEVELASVNFSCTIVEIYRKVPGIM